MSNNLSTLASSLKAYPNLQNHFLNEEETNLVSAEVSTVELLSQKGVYPYDYVDNFGRFEETQLPSKESFYNELNKTHISDEDYKHAQNIRKILT